MTKVIIAGPNLRDQSKGTFHVHAPGCRDLTRVARKEPEYKNATVEDVASRQEIVELLYEDQMDEWERAHPGDTLDWREYDDIYLFPCCEKLDLPDLSPSDDEVEEEDEDDPIEHATSMASEHGASDGEQTAEDALGEAAIAGYMEENVDEVLMEEASSEDLDQVATAYVEAFIDAFTDKCREALHSFLEGEDE